MRFSVPFLLAAAAMSLTVPAVSLSPCAAQETTAPFTPVRMREALANKRSNQDALAAQIHALFGSDGLKNGARPKVTNTPEGLSVAWAIEAPGLKKDQIPQVVTDDPAVPTIKLQRVGKTDIYAGTVFLPRGMAGHWRYEVGGETRATGQYEDYPVNPEEKVQAGVPTGKLTQMPAWRSKIFDGTSRDWWVYVPAQAAAGKPLAVMVFQDGGGPKNWMPTVFDNMIAKGEIPPTVGIFINPGRFDDNRSNRSVEYDTLSDKYARFLLEEILPEVGKTVTLTQNPDERLIYGVSSGGICAFTVAWERPDAFRKVASAVGSFVNLQGGETGIGGGHNYPILIRKSVGNDRKTAPKPIRVYLSDGENDLDNPYGNWPLANQYMAKSLAWAGYDHKFVYGRGFHGDRYGRYLMPDTLRWLWRK
jgi:enterochelin esterase family protein